MAATWQTAEQRWNRLIAIIEEMGFVRAFSWEEALRLSRNGGRAYYTRDEWLGVGSAYIKLREGYDTVEVRISDHAQKNGGGMRYSSLLDDYDRAGESDVSIHPGSPVTLRIGVLMPLDMPDKYIREMVADWAGTGRAITGKWDLLRWFNRMQSKMKFTYNTQKKVHRYVHELSRKLES